MNIINHINHYYKERMLDPPHIEIIGQPTSKQALNVDKADKRIIGFENKSFKKKINLNGEIVVVSCNKFKEDGKTDPNRCSTGIIL